MNKHLPLGHFPPQQSTIEAGMDWNHLHTFNTVVEVGSFTRAGQVLNVSQSAISRQIASLEEKLRMPLFHRHSAGITLTDVGTEFHKAVKFSFDQLSLALRRVNEHNESPGGPLRITTTVTFGSSWLSSRMNEFHARCPNISVSLQLIDDVELDLLKGEADVAIRFQEPTQPRLVRRYLMTMRYHVFASRGYLDKWGVPRSASDLDRHQIIVYGEDTRPPIPNINWLLEAGLTQRRLREPALRINSVYGIYRAVRSGLGIAALPYYLSAEDANLIEILPELAGSGFDVFYVYPEELRSSKRVAVLRDFLIAEAEEYKARIEKLPRQSK